MLSFVTGHGEGHNSGQAVNITAAIVHAHRAQGRDRRRQGPGHDDDRSRDEAGSRRRSVGLLQEVQTATEKYQPLIRPEDQPAIDLNKDTMARYRDEMRKYYFDSTKYKTYLDQLGITYPTIKK